MTRVHRWQRLQRRFFVATSHSVHPVYLGAVTVITSAKNAPVSRDRHVRSFACFASRRAVCSEGRVLRSVRASQQICEGRHHGSARRRLSRTHCRVPTVTVSDGPRGPPEEVGMRFATVRDWAAFPHPPFPFVFSFSLELLCEDLSGAARTLPQVAAMT